MRNILCVCVLPLLESENCHPDFWFGNHNTLAACKNQETTAETAGSSLVLEQGKSVSFHLLLCLMRL